MQPQTYRYLAKIQSLGKKIHLESSNKDDGWNQVNYLIENYQSVAPIVQEHAYEVLQQYATLLDQSVRWREKCTQELQALHEWLEQNKSRLFGISCGNLRIDIQ